MEANHLLMTRRRMLEAMVVVPVSAVIASACGSGDSAGTLASAVSPTATPVPTTAAVTTPAAAATATPVPTTAAVTTPTAAATEVAQAVMTGWASGGTDLITVGYPATSVFDSAGTCALSLTQGTTEGPCYFASDTGQDISLGHTGLPMQLCLRLVDTECQPLADHVIEVWHCDTRGIYSGDTSASADGSRFAGDFCTAGDELAEQSTYYRGQLTTDIEGRVNFMTCLPGWYGGRTIHIHFAVTDPDGTTRVISQFCFTDELTEEICTTHELYADRGVQDTPLAGGRDTVFPSDGYEEFMLTTQRNDDGSLLAFANIEIDPTAVAETSGGGPGGPPPGGERPDRPDRPDA